MSQMEMVDLDSLVPSTHPYRRFQAYLPDTTEDAEGDMVSPPAFPRRRHLAIASLDGSRPISSTVP